MAVRTETAGSIAALSAVFKMFVGEPAGFGAGARRISRKGRQDRKDAVPALGGDDGRWHPLGREPQPALWSFLPGCTTVVLMAPLTEAEADALDERIHACIDRIAAGDRAIAAVARGEAVNPDALEQAADAMAELLAERRLTGPDWSAQDVEKVRRLQALLADGAPSPEARALAATCRLIFIEATGMSSD